MTTTNGFDPTAPLPGPPDPWSSTDTPVRRSGPPYHMTEMIAAEPGLGRRILARHAGADSGAAALAAAVAEAARNGEPIIVTGCGTSEHASLGVADILREAARAAGLPGVGAVSAQAFELSLEPPGSGLVVGVSHEGATSATNAALAAARDAGARTALITVTGRSPGAALADIVLETGELDQSWCHTIGYVSPMLAASAVGAHLSGRALDGDTVARILADGTRDETGAERIAGHLADVAHLIVIASGADRTAARELVLKVEEASWLPSAYRDLETFLHGHLPATGPDTGLVLILADRMARRSRAWHPVRGDTGSGHRRRRGCGADACRPTHRLRGVGPAGSGRRAVRDGDSAPADHGAPRPRERHRSGPDPP